MPGTSNAPKIKGFSPANTVPQIQFTTTIQPPPQQNQCNPRNPWTKNFLISFLAIICRTSGAFYRQGFIISTILSPL